MTHRFRISCVSIVMIALPLFGCEPRPRGLNDFVGAWSAEFSHRPLTQVVYGTIVFDSVATLPRGELRLLGTLHLDSAREHGQKDLIVALLGGPDGCLQLSGPVIAYERSDAILDIDFTPGAADCGLVSQVSAATLTGRWQEPSFVGRRAQGELRLLKLTARVD